MEITRVNLVYFSPTQTTRKTESNGFCFLCGGQGV